MAKRLTNTNVADSEGLQVKIGEIAGCTCVQGAAQRFVETIYERFSASLVLLRLFITVHYDALPEQDRVFVDSRGQATNTSHLIHGTTPIFTLLGTCGIRPEWNDRSASSHFRCIPLASTAFIASLSMLSRQFESVGFDLGLIDDWETKVVATGRADQYRGLLYIRDAATDRDLQGRMIVPKQDFVTANGVKTTLGFGSGYAGHPTLVTLFAFTNEIIEKPVAEPLMDLLEGFISSTESLVGQGRFFEGR